MRIVIFGAGGQVAQRIAREALARTHEVVGVVRNTTGVHSDDERFTIVKGDATDPASVARVSRGADVVINALSPRPSPSGREGTSLAAAARGLIAGVRLAGVKRLIVVGGAGSLEVTPGRRLMDSDGFPPTYKPEALEQAAALDAYKTDGGDLDWTYISPAAETGPGERTGHYRVDENSLLVDASGRSTISFEDYAKAVVDEIEHPTHLRTRMSVAY